MRLSGRLAIGVVRRKCCKRAHLRHNSATKKISSNIIRFVGGPRKPGSDIII